MLRTALRIALLGAVPALALAGCQFEPPATAVRGPETKTLLATIDRPLVFRGMQGPIEVLELPKNDRRVALQLPSDQPQDLPTIHALSGPDDEGRLAYIEDHFFVANERNRRHLLKSVRTDGTGDTELFARPGDAMWALARNGEIGRFLALAPTGGNVALLSQLEPKQMPEAQLFVGRLELWDLDTQAGGSASLLALDQPMAWFPDGKRLVYSMLVARGKLPASTPGLDAFGQYLGWVWDELPCIHIFDLETRQSEFFSVGWQAVVSPDGQTVYVGGWGQDGLVWVSVRVADKRVTRLELPGQCGPVLGVTKRGLLLYWAWPTAGAPIRFTTSNSPLVGPKQMLTIKAADPRTGEFVTVLPSIDPRFQVSFGGAGRSGRGG